MRLVSASARLLASALVACAASGCFLNEIDKSVESAKSASERQATAAAKEAPKPGAPKQTASAEPKASWWATATTLGSEESTADIVPCKLGGKVDFMTRDDCLSRGGATQ